MKLEELSKQAKLEIGEAKNTRELSALQVKYLGRKGELTKILKGLSALSVEKRKEVGRDANLTKKELEKLIEAKKHELLESTEKEPLDITAPGTKYPEGHLHPVTQIYNELFEIGKGLGFSVVEGPEVETDWYNFQALNMPKDHPARDTQASFYFPGDLVLRTQTSPMQIRYMETHKPPIRILSPGRTYRRDSDATHTPMFNQLEGLLVDDRTTFADLKGVLEAFAKGIFGQDRKVRLRPHYFPFTEPSAEVDVSCGLCRGKGCRSCKKGWLEILGAGMVHPNVLENGGIDPNKYQGFAFGMGIERIAMLKYGIDDLRLFYDGDLRFVEQL